MTLMKITGQVSLILKTIYILFDFTSISNLQHGFNLNICLGVDDEREILAKMSFGDTEIKASAIDLQTKQVCLRPHATSWIFSHKDFYLDGVISKQICSLDRLSRPSWTFSTSRIQSTEPGFDFWVRHKPKVLFVF